MSYFIRSHLNIRHETQPDTINLILSAGNSNILAQVGTSPVNTTLPCLPHESITRVAGASAVRHVVQFELQSSPKSSVRPC